MPTYDVADVVTGKAIKIEADAFDLDAASGWARFYQNGVLIAVYKVHWVQREDTG